MILAGAHCLCLGLARAAHLFLKQTRTMHIDRKIILTKFHFIAFAALLLLPGTAAGDWPEFRGGQGLPGITGETIPARVDMLWTFQTEDEIKSSPVVKGNRIVFGSTDQHVYCLDTDGNLLWKFRAGNAMEGPALIHDGIVYIGDLHGNLFAIDLESGREIWKYETDNQIMAAPNWWSDGSKTYILVGAYDYYLHCVDAATGRGVWKYEAQNYLHAAVAVEGNMAIFGGCDGLLHVVDIRTGKAASAIEIASYVAGSAGLDNGRAYIGDYDGMFSCVDYRSGEIKWQFESRDRQLPFIGSPSITGNRVIIGSRDRFIYCLDKASGQPVWQRNTGHRVDASPLADRRNVLVANMRGDLMLLSQQNGDIVWTYELGSPVIGNPAVSGGKIFIGTQDGAIYCLGSP